MRAHFPEQRLVIEPTLPDSQGECCLHVLNTVSEFSRECKAKEVPRSLSQALLRKSTSQNNLGLPSL